MDKTKTSHVFQKIIFHITEPFSRWMQNVNVVALANKHGADIRSAQEAARSKAKGQKNYQHAYKETVIKHGPQHAEKILKNRLRKIAATSNTKAQKKELA